MIRNLGFILSTVENSCKLLKAEECYKDGILKQKKDISRKLKFTRSTFELAVLCDNVKFLIFMRLSDNVRCQC